MRAKFDIKFELDLPSITDKHLMTSRVHAFSSALARELEDYVTRVELLNHTLIIDG